MIKKIYYRKTLIGIRFCISKKGIIPITNYRDALQILTIKHNKGTIVLPHTHIPHKRITTHLAECLIVQKGKVRMDLFSENKKFVGRIFLKRGDGFILINGGHSIYILDDAEIFELKNGPFFKDRILL